MSSSEAPTTDWNDMSRSVCALLLALLMTPVALATAEQVEIETADEARLFADVHLVEAGKSAPLILLFHQASANGRAEYASHIPRLLDAGYNVIVVDQRSGGDRFGGANRTVEARGGQNTDYCDVFPDLEAVLQYAVDNEFSGPRFAWGSSYSAALVIMLGVDHAEALAGILAFSPASGAPMGDCQPNELFAKLSIPALILRPGREAEIESVQKQMKIIREAGLQVYVAANGVHGSSMLVAERVEGDVEAHWKVVLQFLQETVESKE